MIYLENKPEHGAVWIRGFEIRMLIAIGGKLPETSSMELHPKARLKSCAPTETYPLLLISGHRRYSRSSAEKLKRDGWTFVGYPDRWDLGKPTALAPGYEPRVGDILAGRRIGKMGRQTLLLLTDSVTGTAGERPSMGPVAGIYGNILQDWHDLIPFEKRPATVTGSPKTTIEGVADLLGEINETQRAYKAGTQQREAAAAKVAADRAANLASLHAKLDLIVARTEPVPAPPAPPVTPGPQPVPLESLINGLLTSETPWRPAPKTRLSDATALAGVEWLNTERKKWMEIAQGVAQERDTFRDLLTTIGTQLRPDIGASDPFWILGEIESLQNAHKARIADLEEAMRTRSATDLETIEGLRDLNDKYITEIDGLMRQQLHRDTRHQMIVDALADVLGVEWSRGTVDKTVVDGIDVTTYDRFVGDLRTAVWKRETRAAGSTATILAVLIGLGLASYATP